MTTDSGLLAENESLRRQVESYREKEIADLRQRLNEAETRAAHFKAEAERLASVGRQIAAEYQQQVADLKNRLAAYQQVSHNERPKFTRPSRS